MIHSMSRQHAHWRQRAMCEGGASHEAGRLDVRAGDVPTARRDELEVLLATYGDHIAITNRTAEAAEQVGAG